MDTIKKFLLIGCISVLVSCKSPDPIPSPPPVNFELVKNYINTQQKGLDSATEKVNTIEEKSSVIITDVGILKNTLSPIEIPEEVRSKSEEVFTSIIDNATVIQAESKNVKREFLLVSGEHEKIMKMGQFVDYQAGRILYLEGETERLRNEAIQAIYKYLVWVFGLGFLVVIGGSIVAFFVGRKLGISILAIGIVTLGFGAAATFYLKWIAMVGFILMGVGVISTIGLLVYGVFEENAKKNKLTKATMENVKLIDAVKQKLPENVKLQFFGEGNIPGFAQIIQNEDTQKIVADLRGKYVMDESTLA
jgi:hypothetical protein